MKTNVDEPRLLVISDLHLGNPFCRTKREISDFLSYVAGTDFSLCINGDGLDIAQTSIEKLARDAPDILFRLSEIFSRDRHVYYVVGNHDIVFEHLVEAWGGFHVVPFLNVTSGDKRLRIEHGHLYDPFFVKSPEMYEFVTELAGIVLNVSPNAYKLWIRFEQMKSRLRRSGPSWIVGEHPDFEASVREIMQRGFDIVSFGHTHHAGMVKLENGKIYVNSGSWLVRPTYVELDHGEVTLRTWPS